MDKIKYFFECYFNQSANYADMESLVVEFYEIESDNFVNSIKEELSKVKKNQAWNDFMDIAYYSGGRLIQPEKCEEFVNNLIRLFKK